MVRVEQCRFCISLCLNCYSIRDVAWKGGRLRRGLCFRTDTEEVELADPVEASQIPRLNEKAAITMVQKISTAKQPFELKRHKELKPLYAVHLLVRQI